jgi:hypothetical protein
MTLRYWRFGSRNQVAKACSRFLFRHEFVSVMETSVQKHTHGNSMSEIFITVMTSGHRSFLLKTHTCGNNVPMVCVGSQLNA